MQFNPHLTLSRFIGRRDGRRVPGRMPQELLLSSLGPVLDLSAGGMRVLAVKPRSGQLDVRLVEATVSLTVRAKVAWAKRLGFRRYEVGLTFLEVDQNTAQLLTRISAAHRARRVG
jgi:hypothetical protein